MKQLVTAMVAVLPFFGFTQQRSIMEAKEVCIEMVTFKKKLEYNVEETKAAMEKSNVFVEKYNGFIKRIISVNEEGLFLDIVYWESKEHAINAAQKLQQNEEFMKNFEVIDFSTVQMKHFDAFATFAKDE